MNPATNGGTMTLQDALFPTVALELHAPILDSTGAVFANVDDVVLARGNERGRFESILVVNPATGKKIECSSQDLSDVSVIDANVAA
jgi:hypothetical protein